MTAFRLRYGTQDVDLQQREQSFRGYFSLETLTLRHRLFEIYYESNRSLFDTD